MMMMRMIRMMLKIVLLPFKLMQVEPQEQRTRDIFATWILHRVIDELIEGCQCSECRAERNRAERKEELVCGTHVHMSIRWKD